MDRPRPHGRGAGVRIGRLDRPGRRTATLVGVVLVGVLGAAIGRTTAASIDRLTEKAARMEEGDLDVDLESSRIDNIGRLYDGFDAMRTELKATIAEAEDAGGGRSRA